MLELSIQQCQVLGKQFIDTVVKVLVMVLVLVLVLQLFMLQRWPPTQLSNATLQDSRNAYSWRKSFEDRITTAHER